MLSEIMWERIHFENRLSVHRRHTAFCHFIFQSANPAQWFTVASSGRPADAQGDRERIAMAMQPVPPPPTSTTRRSSRRRGVPLVSLDVAAVLVLVLLAVAIGGGSAEKVVCNANRLVCMF